MNARPRTVGALVARATGAARAVRAGQALLVALAASCLAQSAITVDGGAPFAPEAWLVAALCAACAGAAWWFGEPVDARALAHDLDRAFDRGRALETAYEAEPAGGVVAEALAVRALDGLPVGAALRRVVPDSTLAGAAPLLAAALLGLALDARDEPAGGPRLEALAGELADDLARAALGAGAAEGEEGADPTAAAVARAAAEAADLADRARRRPEASTQDAERMDALIDELERLAARAPVDAPWRDALDAARVAADALAGERSGADGGAVPATPAEGVAGAGGGGEPDGDRDGGPAVAGAPATTTAAGGAPERLAPDLAPADVAVVAAWLEHLAERDRP